MQGKTFKLAISHGLGNAISREGNDTEEVVLEFQSLGFSSFVLYDGTYSCSETIECIGGERLRMEGSIVGGNVRQGVVGDGMLCEAHFAAVESVYPPGLALAGEGIKGSHLDPQDTLEAPEKLGGDWDSVGMSELLKGADDDPDLFGLPQSLKHLLWTGLDYKRAVNRSTLY